MNHHDLTDYSFISKDHDSFITVKKQYTTNENFPASDTAA